ncbi:MAG: phosphatase PAP2 family protein [Alphaproteobacteria bacterium]|nr:phosphatase PAP2 family protein [Alphaproteobacteria bacterium]
MLKLQTLIVAATLALAAPAFAQTRPAVDATPIIDGAAISGPAPALESARAAADRLAMHPTVSAERLAQARADIPWSPWVAMNPVFGDTFAEARLPRTARVFADVLNGLSPPIGAAKDAYARRRPFLDNPSVVQCDAPDERLAASGSYPSGHSAGGWAWALVMAELVPSRADAILQRGRDYGDSRVICGYHFPSDIEAGRLLAAGVIARMHADPAFRRDLDAARRELARAYPN